MKSPFTHSRNGSTRSVVLADDSSSPPTHRHRRAYVKERYVKGNRVTVAGSANSRSRGQLPGDFSFPFFERPGSKGPQLHTLIASCVQSSSGSSGFPMARCQTAAVHASACHPLPLVCNLSSRTRRYERFLHCRGSARSRSVRVRSTETPAIRFSFPQSGQSSRRLERREEKSRNPSQRVIDGHPRKGRRWTHRERCGHCPFALFGPFSHTSSTGWPGRRVCCLLPALRKEPADPPIIPLGFVIVEKPDFRTADGQRPARGDLRNPSLGHTVYLRVVHRHDALFGDVLFQRGLETMEKVSVSFPE